MSAIPSVDALLDQLAEHIATRVAERLSQREPEKPPAHEADFLSEAEIARRTGISQRTLQGWRFSGRGPRFTRVGRKVLYPAADLQEFLRARPHGGRPPG